MSGADCVCLKNLVILTWTTLNIILTFNDNFNTIQINIIEIIHWGGVYTNFAHKFSSYTYLMSYCPLI